MFGLDTTNFGRGLGESKEASVDLSKMTEVSIQDQYISTPASVIQVIKS